MTHTAKEAPLARAPLEELSLLGSINRNSKPNASDHAKAKQPAGFRMSSKGLVWVDPSDNEKPEIVVSGPFEVIAESQDDAGYSPARSHSPSRARLSVCRLKEEKVV